MLLVKGWRLENGGVINTHAIKSVQYQDRVLFKVVFVLWFWHHREKASTLDAMLNSRL